MPSRVFSLSWNLRRRETTDARHSKRRRCGLAAPLARKLMKSLRSISFYRLQTIDRGGNDQHCIGPEPTARTDTEDSEGLRSVSELAGPRRGRDRFSPRGLEGLSFWEVRARVRAIRRLLNWLVLKHGLGYPSDCSQQVQMELSNTCTALLYFSRMAGLRFSDRRAFSGVYQLRCRSCL